MYYFLWTLGTAVSMAYARASGPTASRYLDVIAVSIIINLACFFPPLTFLWVALVVTSLGLKTFNHVPRELLVKRQASYKQEINVRNFMTSGDPSDLQDKPF
ncbi:MAG: hypothetical protein IPK04_06395 [Bdellovibrionales bacterium]|nr:hypothetical protein [Bdellovibrionales bacterium]